MVATLSWLMFTRRIVMVATLSGVMFTGRIVMVATLSGVMFTRRIVLVATLTGIILISKNFMDVNYIRCILTLFSYLGIYLQVGFFLVLAFLNFSG